MDRDTCQLEIVFAARDYSTAAVMFHAAVAKRFGLSATDLKTLDVLQRLGPLTAGAIGAQTGLATASVTSLIDRLEKKRFVRRVRNAKDGRSVLVELTSKLEKQVAPLFESLGKRMRRRAGSYDRATGAAIKEFLAESARDMRTEARELAKRRRSANVRSG